MICIYLIGEKNVDLFLGYENEINLFFYFYFYFWNFWYEFYREMSKVSKFMLNFLCVYCICIYLGILYEWIIIFYFVVVW